jgi:hypothetical protein
MPHDVRRRSVSLPLLDVARLAAHRTRGRFGWLCASMPTYVVTSHTAMILLAILALLLSSATDTASQNATGTASLNTMVRRSGPVADLSVPLVALDPNSQYSLLYSLTSLTGLGRDARVEVEVRQGNAVLASKTLHAGDAVSFARIGSPASVDPVADRGQDNSCWLRSSSRFDLSR